MTRVTLGKSRVRENRPPGSVRAKAKWLSYSTTIGVDMDRAVDDSETLEDCFAALGMDRGEFRVAMGHPVVDLPPRDRVFIKEDDPEWPIWNSYLRKTTGRGAPMNKYFGWYFPSRLPLVDSFDRASK